MSFQAIQESRLFLQKTELNEKYPGESGRDPEGDLTYGYTLGLSLSLHYHLVSYWDYYCKKARSFLPLIFAYPLLRSLPSILQLQAPFIAVMQVLVYAGAILVIFMFVIVLFQDAYLAIDSIQAKTTPVACSAALVFLCYSYASRLQLAAISNENTLAVGYGSVEALGKALYHGLFLPF